MSSALHATALVVVAAMSLSLYRLLRGPTHFDRLVGLGLVATKTLLLLVLIGVLTRRTDMLVDIALAYALTGFVGTLAFARFFEVGGMISPDQPGSPRGRGRSRR